MPHGAVQGLGFVRVQMLFVMACTYGLALLHLDGWARTFASALLVVAGSTSLFYVAKFTPLWRVQSLRPESDFDDLVSRTVKIVVCNVKQSNRAYDRFLHMIETEQPDLVVVIETDHLWLDAIATLKSSYRHHVEVPYDTGYGMALYSRLQLAQASVAEIVTDGVPSIRTVVRLPHGVWFRIYTIHPEPPVPHDHSKARDAEIALVGMHAREDPLPAIVTGDLNDVAWSTTTRRFQRLSGLLDPRIGRGFFATFNAFLPFFRWPLDHLFHDAKFRLVEMRRLPPIGSDHFPMLYSVALMESDGDGVLPEPPRPDEVEEVRELIKDAQREDRKPTSTDWERD